MNKRNSTIILGGWCVHIYNPINHIGNKWHYTIFRWVTVRGKGRPHWVPVADNEPEVLHKIGWSHYNRALRAAIYHLNRIRGII